MTPIQVNKTCDELYMGGVYNYSTSTNCEDAEISWKLQDGTVLGHGRFLTRDYCESGIRQVVRCFDPSYVMEYTINVLNSTTPAPKPYGSNNATVTSGLPRFHITTIFVATIFILMSLVILFVVLRYKNRRVVESE
ncbi:uncharacterized protein LOC124628710 isoform X2 [Ictalurus punctatus]|nr:uncharacterized protein LOC124628710 isoform X2 [Ictalurus punctatus]